MSPAPTDPQRRRQIAGRTAVEQALHEGAPIQLLLLREGAELAELTRLAEHRGLPVRLVGAREFQRMSQHPSEEEALALLGPTPQAGLEEWMQRPGAAWLLVGTAYPGNAGFAIRTAEVSGAAGIAVDAPFDRAARRDALRVSLRCDRVFPVTFAAAEEVLQAARGAARRILAIEEVGKRAPWEIDLTPPALFVVGGESSGVPPQLLDACDEVVRIPMRGFLPSYNLQAAMAAVAAEQLRQKGLGEEG